MLVCVSDFSAACPLNDDDALIMMLLVCDTVHTRQVSVHQKSEHRHILKNKKKNVLHVFIGFNRCRALKIDGKRK